MTVTNWTKLSLFLVTYEYSVDSKKYIFYAAFANYVINITDLYLVCVWLHKSFNIKY